MSIAIVTKFLGATNTRGARVVGHISTMRKTVVLPFDHSTDERGNHTAVAQGVLNSLRMAGNHRIIGSAHLEGARWVHLVEQHQEAS